MKIAEELVVTMQVFLKPDGYLMRRPELVLDGRFSGDRNAAYIKSTLTKGKGAATPVNVVNFSIGCFP